MDIILDNKNNKQRKHSFNVYPIKTEEQKNSGYRLSDVNTKVRYLSAIPNINNKRKLFDFISDKNKLSLNTYFDHKGTKEFLIDKNEAMRKIELDEDLEEDFKKSKSKKGSHISKKKISKQKSDGFALKKNSKKLFKTESSLKIKLNKNYNSISTKNLTNNEDSKNNTILKEKFVQFNLKEHSTNDDQIIKSPVQTRKKKKSSLIKKKSKKDNEKERINIDKSINSINTVNSKLFNNEKEYNKFKHLLTKDDIPILEDILYELDVNKK
jgi:hypothetical protein